MTGAGNTVFHTSAHRRQRLLITDIISFIDCPQSAIIQCRVAISALTYVPHSGKTKVLAHCCEFIIYCEDFPSSVRAVTVQQDGIFSMPVERRIEMKAGDDVELSCL